MKFWLDVTTLVAGVVGVLVGFVLAIVHFGSAEGVAWLAVGLAMTAHLRIDNGTER